MRGRLQVTSILPTYRNKPFTFTLTPTRVSEGTWTQSACVWTVGGSWRNTDRPQPNQEPAPLCSPTHHLGQNVMLMHSELFWNLFVTVPRRRSSSRCESRSVFRTWFIIITPQHAQAHRWSVFSVELLPTSQTSQGLNMIDFLLNKDCLIQSYTQEPRGNQCLLCVSVCAWVCLWVCCSAASCLPRGKQREMEMEIKSVCVSFCGVSQGEKLYRSSLCELQLIRTPLFVFTTGSDRVNSCGWKGHRCSL